MEFGNKRNMKGMINLAGTLLGDLGIQEYSRYSNQAGF
jgi:hypothetical protein